MSGIFSLNKVVSYLTAMFVFVLMLDPSDKLLRLKIPIFSLLVLWCILLYKKIDKTLIVCIVLYAILTITSVIGFLSFFNTDNQMLVQFYKTFIMTFMLAWISKFRFLERLVFPAVIIAFIVLFVYIAMLSFPALEVVLYGFFSGVEGTLMMSKRTFLGFSLIAVYYTSAPVLLILIAVSFYRFMNSTKHRFKLFILSLVISLPLLLGGTRAMMLSCIGIILIIILIKMWGNRIWRMIISISIPIFILFILLFVNLLLSDKGEESLDVKIVLIDAFNNHIDKNPITLIWGNGIGATFDSLGTRGTEATQSELTYLELVRWFGIPLGIVFLFIYLYPIILIYRKRNKLPYYMPVILGYFFYLLLSGTNPYLLGSNGMLALLTVYSYSINPYYENNEW